MKRVVTLTFALALVCCVAVAGTPDSERPLGSDETGALDQELPSTTDETGVFAATASTIVPAPAIDFICNCQVCAGGSGPGCRDLKTGRLTSCSSWWASNSSKCP